MWRHRCRHDNQSVGCLDDGTRVQAADDDDDDDDDNGDDSDADGATF